MRMGALLVTYCPTANWRVVNGRCLPRSRDSLTLSVYADFSSKMCGVTSSRKGTFGGIRHFHTGNGRNGSEESFVTRLGIIGS